MWKVVLNGPTIPSKTNTEGNVPKEKEEWTEDDRKSVELNAKAINMMHCAITQEEFRK
ncbi:hypothetical protein PIB30_077113, partial [Stylosanthes scabra]|nr:hypothetical protein [Stylosanthes scabra]